jgi:uncharacterized membrane protein YcaP (DUF421 family)
LPARFFDRSEHVRSLVQLDVQRRAARPDRDAAAQPEMTNADLITGCRVFFDDWFGLLRVLVVGTLAYIGLVAFLRVSGKRTLSKMNAFDFVVTVAMGSTLATAMLSKGVVLLEALLAFALLIGLQWLVAWVAVRSDRFKSLIKSQPTLLFHDRQLLHDALNRERVVEGEVLAAARSAGRDDLDGVAAVVLETDGTLSVVSRSPGEPSSLGPTAAHPA